MSKARRAKEDFMAVVREFFYPLTPDRWGNYKFKSAGKEYRLKFNATSWRFEGKLFHDWFKIGGAYYTSDNCYTVFARVREYYRGRDD